jgi:DNA mismatch endonuclease, patch repair protein
MKTGIEAVFVKWNPVLCCLKSYDSLLTMADVHSPETRSYNMSQIKGKDTKPEMLVRKYLFAQGFRFRLHDKKLPGKPDIVLPKFKTVIFIHGCFWHGHKDCKYFVVPKTRTDWWLEKIGKNKENDVKAKKALKKLGWRVVEVWECQLRLEPKNSLLKKLVNQLKLTNRG